MKQSLWLVYGIDNRAEYSDMDFVADICLTEEAAKHSMEKMKADEAWSDFSFWIDEVEAHD